MFSTLTSKISRIFQKISGNAFISVSDIESALKDIRIALLEADVSVEVVKYFFEKVRTEALGEKVLKSLTPENVIVEIVYKNIVEILKGNDERKLSYKKPLKIMLVGLQGSGKTTTAAKLVQFLKKHHNYKEPLLASVDVYRPAALEQLKLLSKSIDSAFVEADALQDTPIDILKRAMYQGIDKDLFILDTAGRLHTDDILMTKLKELKKMFLPDETFLVIDSMVGQDAITIAREFNDNVGITGSIFTRLDGEPRGGALLSVKYITNVPIRFMGVGERLENLELFDEERIAQRLLGMGDILSLVEKAREASSQDDDKKLMDKIKSGSFDLNDYAKQFSKINSMGGIASILKYIPGLNNMEAMLKGRGIDDSFVGKKLAIISSMTKTERRNPDIIKSSRKNRIASGSGTSVQDVNKLLTEYNLMKDMMKKFSKMSSSDMMSIMKSFMK